MKIAFLFPGQGSQTVGMGKDLYQEYEEARTIYQKVKELTNIDIAKISFEGPEQTLNETKYTQLAILTHSLAILEILKKYPIVAAMSAGLSLGEYTALINSSILSLEEGIRLVQKRGEYMQTLSPKGNWQMAAIIGLEDSIVEEICNKVTTGFVAPANYNGIGQVAISGEEQAVQEAGELAKQKGAKKVSILKTAGPFHTIKLQPAAEALAKELKTITTHPGKTTVIKNIDALAYQPSDDLAQILPKHIISPVLFTKTMQTMLDEDIDTFIEIGPRKNFIKISKKNELTKRNNYFKC